jgi:5-methylcytosine-specific restriction endonuclease McrA
MADLPRNSEAEIRRLTLLPYRDGPGGYRDSIWWKRRRYARMLKAGGKCERCGVVTTKFDVHHVNYDRLGEERDTDLEVLCRTCHEGHHVDETRRHNLGVYLKLASETLRLDQPTTIADFKELLRARCTALQIPIDHRLDDAISATQGRLSLATPARQREVAETPDLGPIGKAEASALCRSLHVGIPFRSMPAGFGVGLGVAATAARVIDRLKAARCPQCRRRGAQPSRVQPGSLWCQACHHRWPLEIRA